MNSVFVPSPTAFVLLCLTLLAPAQVRQRNILSVLRQPSRFNNSAVIESIRRAVGLVLHDLNAFDFKNRCVAINATNDTKTTDGSKP